MSCCYNIMIMYLFESEIWGWHIAKHSLFAEYRRSWNPTQLYRDRDKALIIIRIPIKSTRIWSDVMSWFWALLIQLNWVACPMEPRNKHGNWLVDVYKGHAP